MKIVELFFVLGMHLIMIDAINHSLCGQKSMKCVHESTQDI